MEGAAAGILVPGQAVVRQGGKGVHKPHIVVEALIALQRLVQAFFYVFSGLSKGFVLSGVVCLPEHPRPEAVAPPVKAGGGGQVFISPVLGDVDDFSAGPLNLGGELAQQLFFRLCQPLPVLL